METLSYWLARLEPVIRAETEGEIIVVLCNRCGTEDDAVYAGTSAVLGIHGGEVKVYGILGRGERELLVVDTKQRPKAKLISEPNSTVSNRSQASPCTSKSGMSRSTNAITNPAPRFPATPNTELTIDEIISPMSAVDIGHFDRGRQNEFDAIRALFKPGKEKPAELKPGKASTGKSKEPINPPYLPPKRPQISASGKTQTTNQANSAEGPPRKHTHRHRSSSKGTGKSKEVGMENQQTTPKQIPTTRVEGQQTFIPVNLNSPTFIRPPSTKSRNSSQNRIPNQQVAALTTHDLAEEMKPISSSSSLQQPLKSPPNSAASLPEAFLKMPFPENGFGRRNIRLPPRPQSMIW